MSEPFLCAMSFVYSTLMKKNATRPPSSPGKPAWNADMVSGNAMSSTRAHVPRAEPVAEPEQDGSQ